MEYTLSMSRILTAIRKAIDESGQTRYQISQRTGIAQSQLSRLMSGERGLSVEGIETLADYLGLEIVIRPRRRAGKRGR